MFSWFTGLFTGGTSIVATLASYAIVAALGAAGGAYGMHKIDTASYNALVAANAQAQVAAVQKAKTIQAATDKIAQDAAVKEATAQQQIIVQHNYTTQEITKYVPVHVACITYGIVRLLDAASVGTDPSHVSLGTSEPDDACAPIDARTLAANVIANYYIALQNAEQLNALEAWVTATEGATQ